MRGTVRQTSATTTSSWVPRGPGVSSTCQPRSRSTRGQRGGGARVAAVLEQRPDETALGRLVEVADDGASPVRLVQDPHGRHPTCQLGRRTPERGVRPRPQVDQEAVPEGVAHGVTEDIAPHPCDRAEAREGGVTGEPVRRDPVGRPHQPEHRRRHREPGGGAAPGGGGERVEAEGVVEDAGVDPVGARRRRRLEAGVARQQVELGVADAQDLRRVGPRAHSAERLDHAASYVAEERVREGRQVEWLAARRRGLSFARGQEDEHRARLGSPHGEQSSGPCPCARRQRRSGAAARGHRGDPAGAGGDARLPGGGRAGRGEGGRVTQAASSSTAPTSSW